jgi:hypothetical protein
LTASSDPSRTDYRGAGKYQTGAEKGSPKKAPTEDTENTEQEPKNQQKKSEPPGYGHYNSEQSKGLRRAAARKER